MPRVLQTSWVAPLVVGVGVGQGVGGDLVGSQLAENLAGGVAGSGVDEDVLDQVGVDRVREEEGVEVPDPVGDLLHGEEPIRKGAAARGAASARMPRAGGRRRTRWTSSRG